MLRQRILTAVVLIPIVVLTILYKNPIVFALAAGLVVLLALWEWNGLIGINGIYKRCTYLLLLLLIMAVSYIFIDLQKFLVYAAVIFWICATVGIVYYEQWRSFLSKIAVQLFTGLLILSAAWVSLILLHAEAAYSASILLYLLLLIWTADIGAYFCGKRWGKNKLASLISPGKTWEGVYGSIFLAALLALSYGWYEDFKPVQILIFITLSLFTVGISIVGDLTESIFKRNAGVKDSGNLLPGHGGVLDRIDSLLAAAPFFLCGIWVIGHLK